MLLPGGLLRHGELIFRRLANDLDTELGRPNFDDV